MWLRYKFEITYASSESGNCLGVKKKNRKKTCQETTTNQKKGTSSQFNPSTLAALLGYNQPAGPTSPRVVLSGRRRIFRGSWWLVVHNHGARFCPLRIGLRDPFQMGFLWLKIGSPLTKWDDPPSRLPNTFPLKYLDHKNIPSKHRSPQEVWLEDEGVGCHPSIFQPYLLRSGLLGKCFLGSSHTVDGSEIRPTSWSYWECAIIYRVLCM